MYWNRVILIFFFFKLNKYSCNQKNGRITKRIGSYNNNNWANYEDKFHSYANQK